LKTVNLAANAGHSDLPRYQATHQEDGNQVRLG